MTTSPPTNAHAPRVAVFGFYGNENLGDEAIVEAVIANVRGFIPGANPTCISVNPADSRERHGVVSDSIFTPVAQYKSQRQKIEDQGTALPSSGTASQSGDRRGSLVSKLKSVPMLRPAINLARRILGLPSAIRGHFRFARHIDSVMQRTDALLISGSNQFLDNFGGPSAFPYTLWLWTRIARKHDVPILVLCVGAGPISSRISMRLIRGTINRTDYLSLRDTGSAEVLGLDMERTKIRPDLAFSHKSETVRTALSRDFSLERSPVIAINPMAVHARGYWHEVNDEKYEAYVGQLAELVQYLEGTENDFFFISNQPRDNLVIGDIIDVAVSNGIERSTLEPRFFPSDTVEEYLHNASKADIVIATRFHGTVLALLLARPVIGLCYHEKSVDLLRGFSLGDHAYDMDQFSLEDVIASIGTLSREYATSAATIASRVGDFQEQLDVQYREVERIVTSHTSTQGLQRPA